MSETLAPGTRVRVNDSYGEEKDEYYPDAGVIVGPSRTGVYVKVSFEGNRVGVFSPSELDVLEPDTYCLLDNEGDWWVSDNPENGWVLAHYTFPEGSKYQGLTLATVAAMGIDGRPSREVASDAALEELRERLTGDAVSHPTHYTSHPSGIEVIEITRHMGFCLGNVVKYVLRADHKGNDIEDLRKAIKYLEFEIETRQRNNNDEVSK